MKKTEVLIKIYKFLFLIYILKCKENSKIKKANTKIFLNFRPKV